MLSDKEKQLQLIVEIVRFVQYLRDSSPGATHEQIAHVFVEECGYSYESALRWVRFSFQMLQEVGQ